LELVWRDTNTTLDKLETTSSKDSRLPSSEGTSSAFPPPYHAKLQSHNNNNNNNNKYNSNNNNNKFASTDHIASRVVVLLKQPIHVGEEIFVSGNVALHQTPLVPFDPLVQLLLAVGVGAQVVSHRHVRITTLFLQMAT